MTSIWAALQDRRRTAPGAPVITSFGSDGSRVELSATTLENAAAKIANALADAYDLEPGARVALLLPVHWQRAAWLAGAWTAGCVVALDEPSAADADLVVVTADTSPVGSVAATVAVSLHPLGLPITEPLPAGVTDATIAVRTQPDAFWGAPPTAADPAFVWEAEVLGQQQVLDLAARRAAAWGLEPGGRLLVGPGADPLDAWLAALAVPLAMRASVVLVAGDHDLEHIAGQEKATASLR